MDKSSSALEIHREHGEPSLFEKTRNGDEVVLL